MSLWIGIKSMELATTMMMSMMIISNQGLLYLLAFIDCQFQYKHTKKHLNQSTKKKRPDWSEWINDHNTNNNDLDGERKNTFIQILVFVVKKWKIDTFQKRPQSSLIRYLEYLSINKCKSIKLNAVVLSAFFFYFYVLHANMPIFDISDTNTNRSYHIHKIHLKIWLEINTEELIVKLVLDFKDLYVLIH